MRRLAVYLKHYKKEMILGPIFKLIEAVFELIVPLVMARIIDVGIATQDGGYVLKMGVLLFFLGALGLMCALICQYCAARCSQGFGKMCIRDSSCPLLRHHDARHCPAHAVSARRWPPGRQEKTGS